MDSQKLIYLNKQLYNMIYWPQINQQLHSYNTAQRQCCKYLKLSYSYVVRSHLVLAVYNIRYWQSSYVTHTLFNLQLQNVTGFEKIHLPCIQQQDTIKQQLYHYLTIQADIGVESFPGFFCCGLFLGLVSGACQMSTSARIVFKWLHMPLRDSRL